MKIKIQVEIAKKGGQITAMFHTEDTAVFAHKDYYKKYWVAPDDFTIKFDD